MYGRESITTVFIISTLKTKEMELLATKKEQPTVEGLFVKRKSKNGHSKDNIAAK